MMKFYVDSNQLYNFLILKEPVQLENEVMDNRHITMYYDPKKLIIKTFTRYSTVELKTTKKVIKEWWKNLWKKKKSQKNN